NFMKHEQVLVSIGRAISAMTGHAADLDKMIGSESSEAIPTILSQIGKVYDPLVREHHKELARIQDKIPGISANLPPSINYITGKPELRDEQGLASLLSPFTTHTPS